MGREQIIAVCVLFIVFVLPPSSGLINKIPTPKDLLDCYIYKSLNVSISDTPAKIIQEFCIAKYALENLDDPITYHTNISTSGVRYMDAMYRQLESEIYQADKWNKQPRHKRQAFRTWRVRKEIRTLTDLERNRVFSALNRLKRDYSVDPSMSTYDLIGSLHTGRAARAMHNGPGFFPRHMMMLLIMETAMRVPIPYWDMTMDSEMLDPTQSIVWSNSFFGHGNGALYGGPFGHWRTRMGTPIIRNTGAGGHSLARKSGIRAMLSRRRTIDISEPQPGQSIFSVEVHHNGVHNWIDGYMAGLNTAWWDPVFWFIHSFFQLLWVAFKGLQRSRGIDPQRDYPMSRIIPLDHRYFQRADFRPFTRPASNLELCSDRYDGMVTYLPMPRCPSCGGSRYLTCQRRVCVSNAAVRRRRHFFPMFRGKRSVQYGPKTLATYVSNKTPVKPMPTQENPIHYAVPTPFTSASTTPTSPQRLADDSVNNRTSNILQSSESALSTLNSPYQNTFMVNGVSDMKEWAFVTVRILYERPKGYNFHTGFPGLRQGEDMYDPNNFKKTAKSIGIHDRVSYKQKCSSSGSGAAKIFVQSDGLNYAGRYKDYAIIDERQAVTSTTAFVGVKKPADKETHVLLTAYDTCGRSCRPACPIHNRNDIAYEACSGSFKVTNEFPLMFSSTYGNAVSAQWHINLEGKGPIFRGNTSPITFVCDHQNAWPWAHA